MNTTPLDGGTGEVVVVVDVDVVVVDVDVVVGTGADNEVWADTATAAMTIANPANNDTTFDRIGAD